MDRLSNRQLFPKVLESGKPKLTCWRFVPRGGPTFWFVDGCLLTVHSCGGRSMCSGLSSSPYKDTHFIMGALPLGPHLSLTTSQRTHLKYYHTVARTSVYEFWGEGDTDISSIMCTKTYYLIQVRLSLIMGLSLLICILYTLLNKTKKGWKLWLVRWRNYMWEYVVEIDVKLVTRRST